MTVKLRTAFGISKLFDWSPRKDPFSLESVETSDTTLIRVLRVLMASRARKSRM